MRKPGTYRHQLRALSSIARYLPVFVGLLLATPFTLSVLYDNGESARPAWQTGTELLGLYGGFGCVVLPFIFFVTARLRRGSARQVISAAIREEDLVLELEHRRTLSIPIERIRSGYWYALDDGTIRMSLELAGGLTDGDRVVLHLDADEGEPIARRIVGEAPRFELARTSMAAGFAIVVFSVLVGAALSVPILSELADSVRRLTLDRLLTRHLEAWRLGLGVALSGLVSGVVNMLLAPRTIMLGVDGVRVEVEGLTRRKFIPYESITAVRAGVASLVIEHTDRGEPVGKERRTTIAALGVDPQLVESLAQAIDARRAISPAPVTELLPAWQPGTVLRWKEAIRKRIDATGYRDRSLSNDDLANVLKAPGVSRERRIAAALALAASGDEQDRVRIADAASVLAHDPTRVVLERIHERCMDERPRHRSAGFGRDDDAARTEAAVVEAAVEAELSALFASARTR